MWPRPCPKGFWTGSRPWLLDETASKLGHNYVTVFIDLDRNKQKPIIFVTPDKDKGCLVLFHRFLTVD
ncbi:hypothetical protein DFAR_630035 [Desulfarculales bacterium]